SDDISKVLKVSIDKLSTITKVSAEQILQRFCQEVVAWKRLSHPNVLRFLGVSMVENNFSMVSEWMAHGNILEYMSKNPEVDRLQLVRRFNIPVSGPLTVSKVVDIAD